MTDFQYQQPISLRDLDGFGHVNNAVYLTYVENARAAFLASLFNITRLQDIANIMVHGELDFRVPLTYPDSVTVSVKTSNVGFKSFALLYRLRNSQAALVAEATTVHVAYDFAVGCSIELNPIWRSSLLTWAEESSVD